METVVIKTVNGPVIINKSDFDPEKHVLFEEEAKAAVVVDAPKRRYNRNSK